MNKKFKYTSLVAAGAVTLGLVGGTLAWWSSMDSVTNNFKTLGEEYNPENPNKGITIVEDFDYTKENPAPVTPGSNVNKDVQVQNDVDYPQFIKVSFTKQFVNGSDVITTVDDPQYKAQNTNEVDGKFPLKTDYIQLKFTNHVEKLTATTTLNEGTWYELDGTYYYYGKVAPIGTEVGEGENKKVIDYTNTLLDSVTLSSAADNHYQNLDFKVIVNAESIQASNEAASAEWFKNLTEEDSVLLKLKAGFEALESRDNTKPVDGREVTNADDVDGGCTHHKPEETL